MDEFPCTKCGQCCEKVGKVIANKHLADPLTYSLISKFPYQIKKDGSCEKLIDGLCSVYEDRPLLCNIKSMAKLKGIPLNDYYRQAAEACNMMINDSDLSDEYLVKITDDEKE